MLITLSLMAAIGGVIVAVIGLLSNLVTITKDGASAWTVVKRAFGLSERVDSSALTPSRAEMSGWRGRPTGGANLGNLAANAALGGVSLALGAEILAHHGGHAADLAAATGELLNSADTALVGDLQVLADVPVEAASDLLGALGEFLRS